MVKVPYTIHYDELPKLINNTSEASRQQKSSAAGHISSRAQKETS